MLDFSEVMKDWDLVPNRVICVLEIILKFLDKYAENNPLSEMAFGIMKN